MTLVRHQLMVPLALGGQRFDRALAELLPDYSRSRLTTWIKGGQVTLDGHVVAPRHVLHGGEQVHLEAALATVVEEMAEAMPIEIVFEDEHILVLNKPAGWVVHPGAGNPQGTLLNALLHHAPVLAELPRAGIVHRLDKDTSGLLVVAKSVAAHTALVAMLAGHAVERQYEAVVMGSLIAGGTVDAPLGRHHSDRLRQTVRDECEGRHAVTHYRLRERFRAHSVVQCNLETGRTHQIRVHMAHIHHPLVGDPLYGGGLKLPRAASNGLISALRDFRRQALHAERLCFAHPVSGESRDFQVPRPDDMDALIRELRADSLAQGLEHP